MCTAASYLSRDFYFGRNFDYEISYNETIRITPRNYPLSFKTQDTIESHYAFIGVTAGIDAYPLYYDATNEKGLSIAGLNFAGNAYYHEMDDEKTNIAPFEIIPWILSQCASVSEALELLKDMNVVNIAFSDQLPNSDLHWMIADRKSCIVVESVREGLKIYDNPVGVMTNNPPFDKQLFTLNNYRHLSAKNPENTFSADLNLDEYSRGMGSIGLPGDLSSSSRFAKVAFTKMNSKSSDDEDSSVSQFFHILGSVEQQRGLTFIDEPDKYEITIYSSCVNADKGIYYYRTYDNSQINAVDMHREDLDSSELISYPMIEKQNVNYQN